VIAYAVYIQEIEQVAVHDITWQKRT